MFQKTKLLAVWPGARQTVQKGQLWEVVRLLRREGERLFGQARLGGPIGLLRESSGAQHSQGQRMPPGNNGPRRLLPGASTLVRWSQVTELLSMCSGLVACQCRVKANTPGLPVLRQGCVLCGSNPPRPRADWDRQAHSGALCSKTADVNHRFP